MPNWTRIEKSPISTAAMIRNSTPEAPRSSRRRRSHAPTRMPIRTVTPPFVVLAALRVLLAELADQAFGERHDRVAGEVRDRDTGPDHDQPVHGRGTALVALPRLEPDHHGQEHHLNQSDHLVFPLSEDCLLSQVA